MTNEQKNRAQMVQRPLPLPDLDEIMAQGVGLTRALEFWNKLANAPLETRAYWRDILEHFKAALAAQTQDGER